MSYLGRDEEALDCLNSILRRAPEDYLAYRFSVEERAKLLFRKGSLDTARNDFMSLCKLYEQFEKSRCRKAYFWLGLCELRLGNDAAASDAFGKAGGNVAGNPHLSARYLAVRFLLHRVVTRLLNLLRRVKWAAAEYRRS